MWLRTNCEIAFEIRLPTPFILMLRPRTGTNQWVARESYTLNPTVPVTEYNDDYGNLCQRLLAPPGQFWIHTSADIHTCNPISANSDAPFVEVQNLPNEVMTYLLPTRYCESDRFITLAQEIVEGVKPGYDQVVKVDQWVRETIRFNPNSPYFQMSAVEVYQAREGVCRELTHLAIALCRALCIPARMAVGYLYGLHPMDFHAWFEAYVGGRWYTFDPSQPFHHHEGRVIVAYGHDAADVAIFTQFGPPLIPLYMSVGVERLNDQPE